jgi:hypothetical protein
MRKYILFAGLIIAALVAGVVSVRLKTQAQVRQVVPPHSMVVKQEAYDDTGKKWVSTIIRTVKADGTCELTQILWDGQVKHTTLHLTPITSRAASAEMPELLGYKYFEENGPQADAWISPDLQDYLKLTIKNPDGSIHNEITAVQVSKP